VVAHVLRLRAALLVGALRGDSSHVVRAVVGLVALVALGIIGCLGILSLSDASPDRTATVMVWTGSALVLAFALAPALTGASDPLDPRRFAVFGLAPRGLIATLSIASLISAPLALVVVFAVSGVVVWVGHGASPALATVGAILGVLTCTFAGRVGYALAAIAVREGRGRSLVGLFALGALAGAEQLLGGALGKLFA